MTDDRRFHRTHPWIGFRHHLERADPLHWSLLGEAAARCDQVAQAVLPPADARRMHRLYLVKGVRGTTAIEGNTLSEEQIRAQLEGRLELPPSHRVGDSARRLRAVTGQAPPPRGDPGARSRGRGGPRAGDTRPEPRSGQALRGPDRGRVNFAAGMERVFD